jgi:hypothetical protein
MAAYLWMLAVALIARVVLSGVPVSYVNAGQAVLWSWPMFGALAAATLGGAYLADRAAIPAPFDPKISMVRRLVLPFVWGSVIGGLIILSDAVAPVAAARGWPTMHVPFPASVPFYLYGAILLCVLFHFLPIGAVAWVLTRLRARPPRWVKALAVITLGLSEDGGYFVRNGLPFSAETFRHLLSFGANVTELLFIWNFGLLAGLTQRMATYTWWHLVWGGLE